MPVMGIIWNVGFSEALAPKSKLNKFVPDDSAIAPPAPIEVVQSNVAAILDVAVK